MPSSHGQRSSSSRGFLSRPTRSEVIHLQTLRKVIGFLAFGLPIALVLGENLRDLLLPHVPGTDRVIIEASISAYFHTGMREVFVGVLCAVGVFLVCYNGYERIDNIAANLAGGCAFFIALFPTFERSWEAADTGIPVPDSVTLFSGPDGADPVWVGVIHLVAAAIFFLTLAFMSLFLFTRSNQSQPTPRKHLRNRVYLICGIVMVASIALIGLGQLVLSEEWAEMTSYVFWFEVIALFAFGLSWLTKAEVFFGDQYQGLVQPFSGIRGVTHPRAEGEPVEAGA